MSLLSILSNVIGALPFIQTIITGVESLFGGGNGQTKLEAATSASIAALQAYAAVAGTTLPSSIGADIQVAINANVKVMNDLGLLLPHGSTSTIPAPATPKS